MAVIPAADLAKSVGDLFEKATKLETTLPGGGVNALLAAFLLIALAAQGAYLGLVNAIERGLPLAYFLIDRIFEYLSVRRGHPYQRSDIHTKRRNFARPPRGAFWALPGFLVFSVLTIGVLNTT